MAGANGHRIVAAIDDVLKELRYARWAGFCWEYVTGRNAPAQAFALKEGWLEAGPHARTSGEGQVRLLHVTPAGQAEIDRRWEHA